MAVPALSCGTDTSPAGPVPEDTVAVPRTTARLSILSGDSQVGYTDELLAAPVVVVAHDSLDNPVPNQALICSASAGGTISAPSTNAGGESSVEWTLGLPLGDQSLNCSAGTATVVAGASATDSLLAFVDISTGGREIFIWRPRDSSFVRVTFGANVVSIFGWLSHDRVLYYDGQVKAIGLSGSGSTVVLGQLPCPGNVTWSPDLLSWYYPGWSSADTTRCAIFNFDSITGQERQLRTAPTHNPALHPGGQQIAFVDGDFLQGIQRISVGPLDGTSATVLNSSFRGPDAVDRLRWSADGTKLFFVCHGGCLSNQGIYQIDVQSGDVSPVLVGSARGDEYGRYGYDPGSAASTWFVSVSTDGGVCPCAIYRFTLADGLAATPIRTSAFAPAWKP